MMPKLIAALLLAGALSACSHPALLGRLGDDLNTASPYSLCRAQMSPFSTQAIEQTIERRGIDCSKYASAIAASRATGVALGTSIMQNSQRPVTPIPAYQPPVRTTCERLGYQTQCTTY